MKRPLTDYERFEADPAHRAKLRKEELILAVTNAIAEEMEREAVTRADLAEALKTSRSHVTQLLSGDRNLTLGKVAEIADALGCRLDVKLTPHRRPAIRGRVGSAKPEQRARQRREAPQDRQE